MAKNKMQDLRNHLFETLESLKDDEKPMDIDRALAISTVAGKIIDSAKVEVSYLKITNELPSGEFFNTAGSSPALPQLKSGERRR